MDGAHHWVNAGLQVVQFPLTALPFVIYSAVMADKWKARVVNIGGEPAVILDITIERQCVIEAADYDVAFSQLTDAGLGDVLKFITTVRNLPAETFPYLNVPLTDVSLSNNLTPIATVAAWFERKASFRIEGAVATGLKIVLNHAAVEQKFDVSTTEKVVVFNQWASRLRENTEKAYQNGELTQGQKDAIITICDTAGEASVACESMIRAAADAQRAQDKAERERLQRDLHDRETRANRESYKSVKGDLTGRNFSGE
jgi:hypothetical protein